MSSINNLIASYSDSYCKPTHVSFYPSKYKINIDPKNWFNFWSEYCQLVYDNDNNNNNIDYYLGEITGEETPIVIDLSFEFKNEEKQSGDYYDEPFLLALVKSFQDSIKDNLKLSNEKSEYICCVFDSDDNYINESEEIVQIRLQFPFCKIDKKVFKDVILPNAIQNLRLDNVLSNLTQQPNNDWNKIIKQCYDKDSINYVTLYGSKIMSNYPDLKLNHIYTKISNNIINNLDNCEEEYDIELDECFNLSLHGHILSGYINVDKLKELNDDIYFWLPMFLSTYYGKSVTLPLKNMTSTSYSNNNSIEYSQKEQSNKQIATTLLNILSIKRVEQENYWLDVGKALYNVFDGSEEGLIYWTKFTERSDKKTKEDCEDRYDDFQYENNLTHKTIGWYARQDSPKKYAAWHKSWYTQSMEDAFSLLSDDVALCFKRVFWLDFACTSTSNYGSWYHFENHRWYKVDNGSDIRHAISKDFITILRKYLKCVLDHALETDDKKTKEQADITMDKINKLIKRLKELTYKNKIVRTLADFYHQEDKEFSKKLDDNDCLLGMRNGVIETTDTEAIFREGKPEDFVSMSTGISYPTNYTWNHPKVRALKLWYRQTFIDESILNYVEKLHASLLKGRNSDKLFPACAGDVNNSKSMWKKLIDAGYGPYAIDFPMSVLSGKKSGGPSPELAQATTARIAFLMEPDNGEDFRNGVLKMLTGGDSFFARFCHKDGGKTIAMFKLFLICNQVPIIPNCDKAVKERFRIIPHLSTWVKKHEAPKTLEEQFKERKFPMDKFFDKKIPRMAAAFMWMSVQNYKVYCDEGLVEPKEVLEHTKKYWDENDVFILFTNENIEPAWIDKEKTKKDPSSILSLQDIYTNFGKWFKETYPGIKIPDRSTVKKELSTRWKSKPNSQNCWHGIKVKISVAQI